VTLDCALPAKKGVVIIQAVLSGIGTVADPRGCGQNRCHLLATLDRTHQGGAVKDDIFRKKFADRARGVVP
jgi:hypothetical protein